MGFASRALEEDGSAEIRITGITKKATSTPKKSERIRNANVIHEYKNHQSILVAAASKELT